MDENQTMLLLQQLEQNSRKQTRYAKLQCIFSLAAALCCGGLLIVVLNLLPKLNQVVEQVGAVAVQAEAVTLQAQGLAQQAEDVMTNLETVTRELAESELAEMVKNVDELVTTSHEGVSQALEKMDAMDIEALNKAIANLSAVVEPLAKFFNVFR